jgi:hypothetical protein
MNKDCKKYQKIRDLPRIFKTVISGEMSLEIEQCIPRSPATVSASVTRNHVGSRQIGGFLELQHLGHVMAYAPAVGLLLTSLWSVGVALLTVVVPLTWLGRGGKVPVWMLAKPETTIE